MSPHAAYRALARRTLVFATLSLLLCIIGVATFEPSMGTRSAAAAHDLLVRVENAEGRLGAAHSVMLVVVGMAAGLLAGMLGMGGGVMKVAGMLVFFQLDILLARAVSLTTMFLATASAARVHLRNRMVAWGTVRDMVVPALCAMAGGMLLGNVLPRSVLTHAFAFFALFLGLNSLAQSFVDPNELVLTSGRQRGRDGSQRLTRAAIGGFHGFVCGLLGISGGVVALPMQQTLLRVSARTAVANSVFVSASITGLGSLAAVGMGIARGDFRLGDVMLGTLCIGGGAMVGAQIGARLTGRVRVLHLKLMFALVTFSAGLMILLK